jgi:hypothetical protein
MFHKPEAPAKDLPELEKTFAGASGLWIRVHSGRLEHSLSVGPLVKDRSENLPDPEFRHNPENRQSRLP